MYQTQDDNQRQSISNGDSKLVQSKFTKSLTSFHKKSNPMKKTGPIKTDKNIKNKKVYFSSKKQNNLGFIITNPISPVNNYKFKGIYNNNPIRTTNIPNSAKREYDYKNGYILNNINNYEANIIINNQRKENKCISLNEKKMKNKINNISNNNSKNISKKTNGASNNYINNNSLIRSSENFLNTIAITYNNNENNINGGLYSYKNNKSISNLNDLQDFSSRNKIMKKIKDKNNQNINKNKNNSLKKANTNSKFKSDISKNTNKSSSNQNNNSSSVTNSNNNIYKSQNIEKIENTNTQNEIIDDSEKIDYSDKNLINENTKSYNNFNIINRYDLFYQTEENADDINLQNNNNEENKSNLLKTINTMKSYNQNMISKDNFQEEKDENTNINNNGLQNLIKVNIIDKNNNKIVINEENINNPNAI